jgi:hypothetical protein
MIISPLILEMFKIHILRPDTLISDLWGLSHLKDCLRVKTLIQTTCGGMEIMLNLSLLFLKLLQTVLLSNSDYHLLENST